MSGLSTKPTITKDDMKKALRNSLSPKLLPPDYIPLSVRTMRLLAKGHPLPQDQLSSELQIPAEAIEVFLRDLESFGLADMDDQGVLQGMILSVKKTQHRFRVNGKELFAWCALDTLFLPTVLNETAEVISKCADTGETIQIRVSPTGIEAAKPDDIHISLLAPGITPGTTPQCGSNKLTGAEGLFCSNTLFFGSKEAAARWMESRPNSMVLPLEEAFSLSKEIWAEPFLDGV